MLESGKYTDMCRVIHLVVHLGLLDFDSTFSQRCSALSSELSLVHANFGRQRNTKNQSQPKRLDNQMNHPVVNVP